MHAAHYSSLLPDLFRHKNTKVKVPQPNVVLLDFHGTISERRWEDKVIYPYVKQAVAGYLQSNWTHELVQRCLPGLRNESFEQRFRNKFEDAPVINEPVDGEEELSDPRQLANQMSDFLIWQMNSKKETQETQTIERLVWQDGLRRGKILTPIYEDVLPSVRNWHDKHKCAVYVISSLEHDTLKLLFENTSGGNLNKYLTGFVSTRSGDKLVGDIYKKFLAMLVSSPSAKNPTAWRRPIQANGNPASPPSNERSLSLRSSSRTPTSPPPSSPGSYSRSIKLSKSSSFESLDKPVLFLTDSGQEAKAASRVNEGQSFECLLVNRPGNKRIRTYYLSQFQYIERFDDIEFVK